MDLRFNRDTDTFIDMNIITTPNANTAMSADGGFARVCGKCDGTGIFYRHIQTPDGWSAVRDVCFPCDGTGYIGKVYNTVTEFDKARGAADKARERREAKRQAEWEAGREEREAEEAQRAIEDAGREAELTTWKHLEAQIGDKVTTTGIVALAMSVDTQFGTSRLIIIETDNKEAVKMFTTASWAWDIAKDDTVTIQGTVKSFDEYEGKAQTTVNRPKSIG